MSTAVEPGSIDLDLPQANAALFGHVAAEQTLLDAYRSGRIHHAWIMEGPAGIGKATLAFRFARFILKNPDPAAPAVRAASSLEVEPDDPIARQLSAGSHPNLIVLQRPRDEEGRPTASIIPVDAVRRVGRFFGRTAAGENWRIVIVDAADDFNRASANALLKMLEEPPQRCLFLLIAHHPGRLLPTIRSRCRRLTLMPLDNDTLSGILSGAGIGRSEEGRQLAVRLAGGSLGRAIELASEEGADVARSMLRALDEMPRSDPVGVQKLAEQLGRRGADEAYRLATLLLLEWVADQTRSAARAGAAPALLAPWAEVWENVTRALGEAETYNLDRTQTLLSAFRTVSAAAVRDAPGA